MTIDRRLNWEKHINKLEAKAKRASNAIKVVVGKKLGGDRKTRKKLNSQTSPEEGHFQKKSPLI